MMQKKNNLERNGSFNFKNYINHSIIVVVLAVLLILQFTNALGTTFTYSILPLVTLIGIYLILALSLNMVVGFLGELSLGHAGFMCLGAFFGGKVASLLDSAEYTTNIGILFLTMLIGGLVAAAFGVIIGLPALRLRGDYLAIVTLAFNEITHTVIRSLPENVFGEEPGIKTPIFEEKYFYIIIFAIVLVTIIVIQNLLRSKQGRAIMSIRDNEIAARTMGINVTKYKLTVFAISAFFAGIAGVLFSYNISMVSYQSFTYDKSIEILVMVVLGGMGNMTGTIFSAALITFINTSNLFSGSTISAYRPVIYALILILVVIYRNAPGLKYFREKHNLKNLFSKIFKKKTPEEKMVAMSDKQNKKRKKADKKEEKLSKKSVKVDIDGEKEDE